MNSTVSRAELMRHRLLAENNGPGQAKADLRKTEMEQEPANWAAEIGRVVQRVRNFSGLSLKEFAAELGREERQVARWIAGTERPQFDVLFAVEAFRQPLIIALAELAGQGVEIETVVRVRRSA
jgi:ribosome-binding protein aMBF1 (putative translation factor)